MLWILNAVLLGAPLILAPDLQVHLAPRPAGGVAGNTDCILEVGRIDWVTSELRQQALVACEELKASREVVHVPKH